MRTSRILTGSAVHVITLDAVSTAAPVQHDLAQRLTFPAVLAFAPLESSVSDFISQHQTTFTGLIAPVIILCTNVTYITR
jgi:hypothetical protein